VDAAHETYGACGNQSPGRPIAHNSDGSKETSHSPRVWCGFLQFVLKASDVGGELSPGRWRQSKLALQVADLPDEVSRLAEFRSDLLRGLA
jgi:hypothetical protein